MEEISCPVCFNVYLSETSTVDRRPTICCQNGHSVCSDCCARLKTYESDLPCPTCRDPLLATPIINRALLEVIDNYTKAYDRVPEINISEMTMAVEPFASGAFADVYDAKWHSQDVAVKALRPMSEIDKQLNQLRLEANLAIGLHHPNIVRLYGTTKISGNRFGIVMEKVDNGSLDKYIYSLDQQKAVQIGLGIIDGLDYVHSRKVAHRDLKPQNILLSGPYMIPKISDFGVSKVIQTVITNSAMIGTPKYAAPELLEAGNQYGVSVDIFSLAVVLFEMFSGRPAEQGLGQTVMQIMLAVTRGKRPSIPNNFPNALRPVIEKGWDQEPSSRASLDAFRKALQSMVSPTTKSVPKPAEQKRDTRVSMMDQAEIVARVSLPLPVLSLKWSTDCEMLNSQQLRVAMVEGIKSKSNMKQIINGSVLSVMKVIPRHLFIEETRMPALIGKSTASQQEIVTGAYLYNKPIPATLNTNESSPEIIGTQLSLTEIIQGQSVLLVGMKGGYIQSLVAQLVGRNGMVVTATSNSAAMTVCRERVSTFCPLKSIVHWVEVSDVTNQKQIVSAMQQRKMIFHTVIYCGSVDAFPDGLSAVLSQSGNVSIMAPVKIGSGMQFQLYVRHDGVSQMKTITDFGVLFEEIK